MPVMTLLRRVALPMAALFTITSCSTVSDLGSTFFGGGGGGVDAVRVKGFLGAVVADEPTAAVAGREVLALGGTAADAAVAIGFTLAVTYPSRASLGAGGACLAYSTAKTRPGDGSPEAIVFTPVAPTTVVPRTDRPAAIPMLARGLFALHARYGRRPFETLVSPAEQLARFGTPASRAFVRDLTLVAGPLMTDPNARAVFAPRGVPLTEGTTMVQPDLGGTLSQIRTVGVGDLYQGTLGRRLELASAQAGGGLTVTDMRAALPKTLTPIVLSARNDKRHGRAGSPGPRAGRRRRVAGRRR
jgi:gamma-glutamyltranspeptidase/glutathione hydrolase